MATEKSIKPANLVPRSFGGEKNNFSDDLIASGFEPNTPETYNGDNLNYQLDATGKELDYCEKVVDYINGLGVGKTPIVNTNNKLDETQVGLKVYSATETYSLGEWVRSGDKIYQSLTQGNLGNDLTNETYWKEVELGGLPSQLNKNGKFLKTDGTQASWEDIPPATMLNLKSNLMRANGKKVKFVCSEGAPVTVTFPDNTVKTFTSITDLDLSSSSANTYNITIQKSGQVFLNGSSEKATLGSVTLTADGITNITNNYQAEAINPLQEVTVHTKESYVKSTEVLPTNLDLIPFTFVDLDYSSYVTVSANTAYTLTKDVMVNTNSISTFTITKDGANYTVYGTWLPVRAGTTFKSSVAGKYYSFEGY